MTNAKKIQAKSGSSAKGSAKALGPFPLELEDPATGRKVPGSISMHYADSGRLVVDEITLRGVGEYGLEPIDVQNLGRVLHPYLVGLAHAVANNLRPTGDAAQPFELVESEEPIDMWLMHLQRVVPGREGESKAQWIARVWREYYEPTGRSMKELGEDLGLTHATVRGYCSQEDPTRVKPVRKGGKSG